MSRRTTALHGSMKLIVLALFPFLSGPLLSQDADLVVNIVSDQPAYMAFDLQSFTVTISNNGPDAATDVELVVEHPIADVPFEESATCQASAGNNPNGPAVCPPGSDTAPSAAFVRDGQTFVINIPEIPALAQAEIEFQTSAYCPHPTVESPPASVSRRAISPLPRTLSRPSPAPTNRPTTAPPTSFCFPRTYSTPWKSSRHPRRQPPAPSSNTNSNFTVSAFTLPTCST